MTRRGDDYDPDEGGRWDGDEPRYVPFDNPEWLAIVAEQEAAKQAAFDAHQARLYGKPVQSSDDRHCPTCHGHGTLTDTYAYGPAALLTCHRCGGARTR